ncbi:hypothetical protein ACET3Z_013180 [Daucus carota]
MCVDYKLGDDLPSKIPVKVLDNSGKHGVVDIHVEYVNKPQVCTGCKALGHTVASCPVTQRIWVQKRAPSAPPGVQVTLNEDRIDAVKPVLSTGLDQSPVPSAINENTSGPVVDEQPWQSVSKKHSFALKHGPTSSSSPLSSGNNFSNDSPPVSEAFKNLRKVDELDQSLGPRLSKAQRKRLKHSPGKVPPSPPSV